MNKPSKKADKFENWNVLKQEIHFNKMRPFFKEREIWWASFGYNIGDEQYGKNDNFERPVLIVKRFYRNLFLCLPISSSTKSGDYYFKIRGDSIYGDLVMSQARVLDAKRLLRKVDVLNLKSFNDVVDRYKALL